MSCRVDRLLTVSALIALVAACAKEPTAPEQRIPAVADSLFGVGETRWFRLDTLGGGTMPPPIDMDRVYFTRGEFKFPSGLAAVELVALDRSTGALVWNQRVLNHRGALAGETIATAHGALALFNRRTGAAARTSFVGSVASNLVSDGTRFYFGTWYGHVAAVNGSTGAVDWDTNLADGNSTTAFGIGIAGDLLAVTLKYFPPAYPWVDSGVVAVLNRQSGVVQWRRAFAGSLTEEASIIDPPVFAGSVVGAVTEFHTVYALDVSSGATRWTYDATRGRPNFASYGIAACDGAIFVSDGTQGLVSLDAASGVENWRLPDLQTGGLYSIDCAYGTVLTLASYLRVFDARTGTLLRRVPVGDRNGTFIMSAARDDRSIYVSTEYGFGAMKAP